MSTCMESSCFPGFLETQILSRFALLALNRSKTRPGGECLSPAKELPEPTRRITLKSSI